MSKDKQNYLAAFIPEVKPKETPKRSGMKSDGRLDEIEEAIRAFNDLLTKQNRDNLDAMYNIDMGNMSSSMRRLFQSYDDGITQANASIEAWAKETEAGFKAVAEWQGQTNESISSIDGKADANAASITLLNQWKGETSSSLAAVQVKASQNESQITALASWKNTAEDDIDGLSETMAAIEATADENGVRIDQIVSAIGEDGKVTFASIAAGIAEDESFIKLIADGVDISGFVTFESLENDGEATVNGNNLSLISDNNGDSMSRISYWFEEKDAGYKEIASIFSLYDTGEDDDIFESDYSLVVETYTFRNANSGLRDAALMLKSAAGMKLIAGTNGSGGILLSCPGRTLIEPDRDCTIIATSGTRIYAGEDYDYYNNRDSVDDYTYVFCADGIYYNGYRIIDTPN